MIYLKAISAFLLLASAKSQLTEKYHKNCDFGHYGEDCQINYLDNSTVALLDTNFYEISPYNSTELNSEKNQDYKLAVDKIQKSVDDYINIHHVLLFSKDYCPDANQAKEYLNHIISYLQLQVKEKFPETFDDVEKIVPNLVSLEINILPEDNTNTQILMEVIQDYYAEKYTNGDTTVPQLFLGGKFIGNNFKIVELFDDRKSDDLEKKSKGLEFLKQFFVDF